MKILKKHQLKINPKFMAFGRANWYKESFHLKKYYCYTPATVSQLRKLNVPSAKATWDLYNAYGSHWFPEIVNIIRRKDREKVNEYLEQVKLKKAA